MSSISDLVTEIEKLEYSVKNYNRLVKGDVWFYTGNPSLAYYYIGTTSSFNYVLNKLITVSRDKEFYHMDLDYFRKHFSRPGLDLDQLKVRLSKDKAELAKLQSRELNKHSQWIGKYRVGGISDRCIYTIVHETMKIYDSTGSVIDGVGYSNQGNFYVKSYKDFLEQFIRWNVEVVEDV